MIALLLLLALTSVSAFPIAIYREVLTGTAVCSSADALARDFTVTLSTDTPTKGENVTTTFDFTLDAPITGGTAYYAATLNGFPYSSSAPLCDEVAKTGDPCPLAAGHHHQESVSAATTSGKITVKITWNNEAGAEILCAEVTTKTV